jgi:hypothetical protein
MVKISQAATLFVVSLASCAARPVTSSSARVAFVGSSGSGSSSSSKYVRSYHATTATSLAASKSLPVKCGEDVMSPKAHGTTEKPVVKDLRWNCDYEVADRICCFNRHYAEYAGYWQTTDFMAEAAQVAAADPDGTIDYYDSVTAERLFTAPVGRSMKAFLDESLSHGWPSFRDEEVNWDYVRCLDNGECVSTAGTHLGHNLPDFSGNRYVIVISSNRLVQRRNKRICLAE